MSRPKRAASRKISFVDDHDKEEPKVAPRPKQGTKSTPPPEVARPASRPQHHPTTLAAADDNLKIIGDLPAGAETVDDPWVQCERCDKWRRLPPGSALPGDDDRWFCEMNPDRRFHKCDVPEEGWQLLTNAEGAAFYLPTGLIAPLPPGTAGLPPGAGPAVEIGVGLGGPPPPVAPRAGPGPGSTSTSFVDPRNPRLGVAKGRGRGRGRGRAFIEAAVGQWAGTRAARAAFQSMPRPDVWRLRKACEALIEGRGEWTAALTPDEAPHAVAALKVPPRWVWEGMARLCPREHERAVEAVDHASAIAYAHGTATQLAGQAYGAIHNGAVAVLALIEMATEW